MSQRRQFNKKYDTKTELAFFFFFFYFRFYISNNIGTYNAAKGPVKLVLTPRRFIIIIIISQLLTVLRRWF